jgi:hypothetical protein
MPSARRFPPPWTIDEHNDACFIVRDATGQALGYFYFEEEPGRRSAAKLLTRDEARAAWRRISPSCRSCCGGAVKSASDRNNPTTCCRSPSAWRARSARRSSHRRAGRFSTGHHAALAAAWS